MTTNLHETEKIAALNDKLRQTLLAGEIKLSDGIQALSQQKRIEILDGVENYNAFAPQGDNQKEKDFGAFSCGEHDIYWEIDCYDENGVWTSLDRDKPDKTNRHLKIMLMEEAD